MSLSASPLAQAARSTRLVDRLTSATRSSLHNPEQSATFDCRCAQSSKADHTHSIATIMMTSNWHDYKKKGLVRCQVKCMSQSMWRRSCRQHTTENNCWEQRTEMDKAYCQNWSEISWTRAHHHMFDLFSVRRALHRGTVHSESSRNRNTLSQQLPAMMSLVTITMLSCA